MIENVGYHHGKVVLVDLVPIDAEHMLHRPAAESFIRMRDAAKVCGIALIVNSAFRSRDKQEQLYEEYKAALAKKLPHALVARPGWSNHQSGVALDVLTHGEHADALAWLTARAHEFEFVRTVPSETWHWEWRATTATTASPPGPR